MEVNEKDWKLFRSKLPEWQNNHIAQLNQSYIELLKDDSREPSEKFWKLERKINSDKRHSGVCAEVKRSNMFRTLLSLLDDGVICFDDLNEFSSDTKDRFAFFSKI